jgi:type II secretion system protein H
MFVTMRKSANGFSLIELLVVMFIIGLMFGAVSLSVNFGGDPEDQLQEESERLLEFARLAQERAVLTGEPVGLRLIPPAASADTAPVDSVDTEPSWRYQWQLYRAGQWFRAEEPLSSQSIPGHIELSLQVEGQEVDLLAVENAAAEASQMRGGEEEQGQQALPLPSIVFYPGGEITSFYLTLFDAEEIDQQQVLTSQRTGAVELLDEEEALLTTAR